MTWEIRFLDDAKKDLAKMDHSLQSQVLKGIYKVAQNPLPQHEGGYGKPLGGSLTNLQKIKFRNIGVRVVYKIEISDSVMKIIIISARADNQVYREAARRLQKYNL